MTPGPCDVLSSSSPLPPCFAASLLRFFHLRSRCLFPFRTDRRCARFPPTFAAASCTALAAMYVHLHVRPHEHGRGAFRPRERGTLSARRRAPPRHHRRRSRGVAPDPVDRGAMEQLERPRRGPRPRSRHRRSPHRRQGDALHRRVLQRRPDALRLQPRERERRRPAPAPVQCGASRLVAALPDLPHHRRAPAPSPRAAVAARATRTAAVRRDITTGGAGGAAESRAAAFQ